jgi:hypothetical protein
MSDTDQPIQFDTQAAWLRRFTSDAESNLGAFALRLKEAMPERVKLHERRGLFSRNATTTGVTVEMDQNHYRLDLVNGRLQASVAMVVRGVALNTKQLDPADWFAKLLEETRAASEHAQRLARSLSAFMAS